MKQRGIDFAATTALLVALLCWASVPLVLKHLTHTIPDGFTTNAVRYPAAAILYLPLVIVALRDPAQRRLVPLTLLPTIPNLAGQTCWAWAPYYIDPGLMTFGARTSVIWAIVLAVLFFPIERSLLRSPRFWAGILLSFGGFLGVALFEQTVRTRTTQFGLLLAGVSGFFGGLYVVGIRAAVGPMKPFTTFAFVSAFTAVGCLAMAPLGEPSSLLHAGAASFGLLLLSSFLGIAFAHGLYYFAVQRLGATICAATATLSPFITAAASRVIFQERLDPVQWLGGIVLVCGTALVIWSQEHLSPLEPE